MPTSACLNRLGDELNDNVAGPGKTSLSQAKQREIDLVKQGQIDHSIRKSYES